MASNALLVVPRWWLIGFALIFTIVISLYNYGHTSPISPVQTYDAISSDRLSFPSSRKTQKIDPPTVTEAPLNQTTLSPTFTRDSKPEPSTASVSSKVVSSTIPLVLVVASLKEEDTSWVARELPDIKNAIYTVDDPQAALTVPVNKGHESISYLSWVIDQYNDLPDITIFVHSHQVAYHNNDLLDSDMPKMVRRLNHAHVQREGYFNLRCHHEPGCPDWIHTNKTEQDTNRKEEVVFAKIWQDLHPGKPMPSVLSVPCCSQFAASRDKLRTIPLDEWKRYRKWLIDTDLDDELSGRVWEYTWHYILTRKAELCPSMYSCYCQGYHICFPSEKRFDAWFSRRKDMDKLQKKVGELKEEDKDPGEVIKQIDEIRDVLDKEKQDAFRLGDERRKAGPG